MEYIHSNVGITTYMVPLRSKGTAYLWWFFLGAFGAHQFYLGKTGRAVSMLVTLGWLTVGVWIDMFTLGKQVRRENERLAVELAEFTRRQAGQLAGESTMYEV